MSLCGPRLPLALLLVAACTPLQPHHGVGAARMALVVDDITAAESTPVAAHTARQLQQLSLPPLPLPPPLTLPPLPVPPFGVPPFGLPPLPGAADVAAAATDQARSWLDKVKDFFTLRNSLLVAGGVAALVAVIALVCMWRTCVVKRGGSVAPGGDAAEGRPAPAGGQQPPEVCCRQPARALRHAMPSPARSTHDLTRRAS